MNHGQTPYPAHLEAVKPLVLDRRHLAVAHPIFEELRLEVIRHIQAEGAQMPLSVAVLVAVGLLQPTLLQHLQDSGVETKDVSAEALVLYLPKQFAGVAHELATKQPAVFNAELLNLRGAATYLGWSVKLPGEEEPTVVRLPEHGMWGSVLSNAYHYVTRQWSWMPVVVVSGDVVTIGGFLVEESFIMDLQAAAMSSQSCEPENVYSNDELQRADELACVHGLEPWKHA